MIQGEDKQGDGVRKGWRGEEWVHHYMGLLSWSEINKEHALFISIL